MLGTQTESTQTIAAPHTIQQPHNEEKPVEQKAFKVTMNLSQRDVDNTAVVRDKFHSRSNAAAVSIALGVTKTIAEIVDDGGEILVRNKGGQIERVIITGLD